MLFETDQMGVFLLAMFGAWASYTWIAHQVATKPDVFRSKMLTLCIFAALFRIVMVMLPPIAADDYQRYLFDGRALLSGLNTYAITPLDYPELGGGTIPRPEIKTIYPPAAEMLFLINGWIGKYLGNSLVSWRLLNLFADFMIAVLLSGLLRYHGKAQALLLIYLWNPLIHKELINSAHIDCWSLLAITAFIYCWQHKQAVGALVMICGAALIKLVPVILIIPWLRSLPSNKHRLVFVLAGMILAEASLLPFFPWHPSPSLLKWFSHIEGYGVLFNVGAPLLGSTYSRMAITVVGALLLCHLVFFSNRYVSSEPDDVQTDPIRSLELLLIVFLFSSMGFPWYLAPVVLLLLFRWTACLCLFIGFVQLTYYSGINSLLAPLLMSAATIVFVLSLVKHKAVLR